MSARTGRAAGVDKGEVVHTNPHVINAGLQELGEVGCRCTGPGAHHRCRSCRDKSFRERFCRCFREGVQMVARTKGRGVPTGICGCYLAGRLVGLEAARRLHPKRAYRRMPG